MSNKPEGPKLNSTLNNVLSDCDWAAELIDWQEAEITKLKTQLHAANGMGLRTYDKMTTYYENRIKGMKARIKELEDEHHEITCAT